jgi:broad specificity phosphatase PhoE
VVSNPLLRASQTAREIATAFGPRAKPDVRLADGDLDWMEGLSYSESSLMSAKGNAWVSAEVHGRESLEAVGDRWRPRPTRSSS